MANRTLKNPSLIQLYLCIWTAPSEDVGEACYFSSHSACSGAATLALSS